jgi:lysozyme
MAKIVPLAVDLSHWDPAHDYDQVRQDGIVGVIYKATEGQTYTDPTYVEQQQAAKAAGLKWGSYHFADSSPVGGQIKNYLRFAAPDPDELFCLDWEDNPTGNGMMSVADCKVWIKEVEDALGRQGQCVIYSGNTAKEQLGDREDSFFGSRRLWLAQYSPTPTWQRSWSGFWLWQFTDGVYGPTPHSVDGIGNCDINSYEQGKESLALEWATGVVEPAPEPEPIPGEPVVTVLVSAPAGVAVKVRQISASPDDLRVAKKRRSHLGDGP